MCARRHVGFLEADVAAFQSGEATLAMGIGSIGLQRAGAISVNIYFATVSLEAQDMLILPSQVFQSSFQLSGTEIPAWQCGRYDPTGGALRATVTLF
jgi:hypothetical protein